MNFIYPLVEGTSLQDFTSPYLQDFSGKAGEQAYFLDESGNRHQFIGLGKADHQLSAVQALRSFFFKAKKTLKGPVNVRFLGEAERAFASEVVQGIYLAEYEIGYLKGDKKDHWFSSGAALTFETEEENVIKGKIMAEAIKRVVRWGDAPGNYKTPSSWPRGYRRRAKKVGIPWNAGTHPCSSKKGCRLCLV
jgi:leucyl aminopeptidase